MTDPDLEILAEMRALAARLARARDPLLAGAVAQLVGQIEGLLDLYSTNEATERARSLSPSGRGSG